MTKKDEQKIKNVGELDQTEKIEEEKNGDKEIEELKQKLEQFDNNYKRALADYQNLQKRVSDERRSLILSANRELLLRILSVLDTLVLANQHVENEGLKVAINQFLDVLKSEGVTKIDSVGQEFATMEAIATEPGEEGKVIEEIRTGYLLNDKLLRAAQVKVGSAK